MCVYSLICSRLLSFIFFHLHISRYQWLLLIFSFAFIFVSHLQTFNSYESLDPYIHGSFTPKYLCEPHVHVLSIFVIFYPFSLTLHICFTYLKIKDKKNWSPKEQHFKPFNLLSPKLWANHANFFFLLFWVKRCAFFFLSKVCTWYVLMLHSLTIHSLRLESKKKWKEVKICSDLLYPLRFLNKFKQVYR